MNGAEIIAQERQRQIIIEGWTPEHDDQHVKGELAIAGACYAFPSPRPLDLKMLWPWGREGWKPVQTFSPDPTEVANCRIKELAKAGALIAAEIDRLQRVVETRYARSFRG